MPELPDITLYIEALRRVAGGTTLEEIRVADPFVLRTVVPPAEACPGCIGGREMAISTSSLIKTTTSFSV